VEYSFVQNEKKARFIIPSKEEGEEQAVRNLT
jgi:hypothetical protein